MASAGISFTPGYINGTLATATGVVPFGGPVLLALPTSDGTNLDLLVTNSGPSRISLAFGQTAGVPAAIGPGVAGQIAVPGAGSILITENPAVIAAANAAGDPNVISGALVSGVWGQPTVTALAQQYGGTLTFTRGIASAPVLV